MVRGGPGSYKLRMNESEIEAEIHTLRDGGLLMQARILVKHSALIRPLHWLPTILALTYYLVHGYMSWMLQMVFTWHDT